MLKITLAESLTQSEFNNGTWNELLTRTLKNGQPKTGTENKIRTLKNNEMATPCIINCLVTADLRKFRWNFLSVICLLI
jgi:hypothetical protein